MVKFCGDALMVVFPGDTEPMDTAVELSEAVGRSRTMTQVIDSMTSVQRIPQTPTPDSPTLQLDATHVQRDSQNNPSTSTNKRQIEATTRARLAMQVRIPNEHTAPPRNPPCGVRGRGDGVEMAWRWRFSNYIR